MQATTKTRFDYKAAHAALCEPAVQSLPNAVLSLYRELRDAPDFDKLAQGANLDVPMPERLRPLFEALDSETLAFAARALYDFGHWASGGARLAGVRDTRGATWKFANLADQVLRVRLKLPTRGSAKSIGYHFEVHEGALLLCASTPDSWTWLEVGPATEAFLAEARAWRETLPGCPASRYSRHLEDWQAFESGAYEATRKLPEVLAAKLSEPWLGFLRAGETFTKSEGQCSDDCPECGRSALFGKPECNHELKCSKYPLSARIDAVLCHGSTFGLTPEQVEAARAAILATPSTGRATPPTAHEALPGDNL